MIVLKHEFRGKLPIANEYDSIQDLANVIKLIIGLSTNEFDLSNDSGCITLIDWYLDDYSMSFDKAFAILPKEQKTNSINSLEVDFYFKNTNSNKSFEKINELRNIGYLIDFEPDVCMSDLDAIVVIMVDGNKCIGLINQNEYDEQEYRFKNYKQIII